jgi:hypothetical protein
MLKRYLNILPFEVMDFLTFPLESMYRLLCFETANEKIDNIIRTARQKIEIIYILKNTFP